MNEKLKEPRIYLCAAVFISMFLPWASCESSADVMGISASGSASISGVALLQSNFITSVFIFLIPGLLICLDLIPSIKIPMRLPYLLAPIVSVIMSVVSILLYKSKSSSSLSFGGDSSMDISLHIKIGFIITILLFIAIIVYTLIHDFALDKDAIKEKGLKGAISDIAGEVSGEMSETVKKTNFELPSSKCPQCGSPVTIGKKFCPKCGYKMQTTSSLSGTNRRTSANSSTPLTVQQYIDNLNTVKCQNCNNDVPVSTRFCPQCGEKVEIKVYPENCESCGKPLIKGKNYCPDCGTKVNTIKLITKCSNCSSDLYFGKKYCPDCGTKVQ